MQKEKNIVYKINRNEENQFESLVQFKRVDGADISDNSYMLKELDLENLLSENLEIIFENEDNERDMQIVGRQMFDANNKRSDLVALSDDGSLVVIELKRFAKDIMNREENFAMQAVRYAASLATIQSIEDLIEISYIPYLKKYSPIEEYILNNDSEAYRSKADESIYNLLGDDFDVDLFNNKQKIILVAFSFDDETLSSVAWLSENGIDIQCIEIQVYENNGEHFIFPNKILPALKSEDFYIEFKSGNTKTLKKKSITRRNLPRIDKLIEWGVVNPGEALYTADKKNKATLLNNGNVRSGHGEEQSLNSWLKGILKYSSVKTYMNSFNEEGISLSQLRREYMEEQGLDY